MAGGGEVGCTVIEEAMRAVTELGSLMAWPGQFFIDSSCCFFGGAGTSSPQGQRFHVLYAKLLLTHCFMSLSAYPGTEVNRLCVIRK